MESRIQLAFKLTTALETVDFPHLEEGRMVDDYSPRKSVLSPLVHGKEGIWLENTGPSESDNILSFLKDHRRTTSSVVVSKSCCTGGTRHGMLEAARKRAAMDFGRHTSLLASQNSDLDKPALQKRLAQDPRLDRVGGRTSELSASSPPLDGGEASSLSCSLNALFDSLQLSPSFSGQPSDIIL